MKGNSAENGAVCMCVCGGGWREVYMVQNRLENWGLNPMTFVDVTNLVSFKSNEMLQRGFNSKDENGADTIISLLWKYYCGCIVEAAL